MSCAILEHCILYLSIVQYAKFAFMLSLWLYSVYTVYSRTSCVLPKLSHHFCTVYMPVLFPLLVVAFVNLAVASYCTLHIFCEQHISYGSL